MTLENKERIWCVEPHPSIVKLVSYDGISTIALYVCLLPLIEQLGEAMVRETKYVLCKAEYHKDKPYWVKLKLEVSKVVYPILGPDPLNVPWWTKDGWTMAALPPANVRRRSKATAGQGEQETQEGKELAPRTLALLLRRAFLAA